MPAKKSPVRAKLSRLGIRPEAKREIKLSLDRTVTVGPGTSQDPGVWMLLPQGCHALLRWMTPADARLIGHALFEAATKAEVEAPVKHKNGRAV